MSMRKNDVLRRIFDNKDYEPYGIRNLKTHYKRNKSSLFEDRMKRRKSEPDKLAILMKIIMTIVPMAIVLSVGVIVMNEVREQIGSINNDTIEDVIPINEYDEYPLPDESQILNTDNISIQTVNETIAKYKSTTDYDDLGILDMDIDFGVI